MAGLGRAGNGARPGILDYATIARARRLNKALDFDAIRHPFAPAPQSPPVARVGGEW